jgi:rubrerythrin
MKIQIQKVEVEDMELKGSKTEENLKKAFAGESQARNKYTYYGDKAAQEGLNDVASAFYETARNEQEHARLWFEALMGGTIYDSIANLKDAASGENDEWMNMYKEFAQTAREEGFNDIANKFEQIAKIEKNHEGRYQNLLDNLQKKKEEEPKPVTWMCTICGYTQVSVNPPETCPVCGYGAEFFEQVEES